MKRVHFPVDARLRTAAMALLVMLRLLLVPSTSEAAPISVRMPEGSLRGFLVVRSMDRQPIGYGEIRQEPRNALIESRLLLTFTDGSVHDETAAFSQSHVFTLHAYRLRQHGPSFATTEISFDRKTGQYQALVQQKKGAAEKKASGALEMPPDLYNGMALILLKNLPAEATADVKMAAFTPKPRVLTMKLRQEGDENALLGGHPKKVIRYLVKLEIGGVTGVIASFLGKSPPDLRYWFVPGDVPAFVKFEGAMFLNGPVWRLELTTLEWPKTREAR